MTAAIALSIVLLIGVAGVSLAMQTQRPPQMGRARPARPQPTVRRPVRERRTPPAPVPVPETEGKVEEPKGPELLRIGVAAPATVLGVVDERTTGSIVRSRLNLRVVPGEGNPFEVTVRHVFASLDARSKVRVGGKVLVRFDPDDHSRVVVAPDEPVASVEPKAAPAEAKPATSNPAEARLAESTPASAEPKPGEAKPATAESQPAESQRAESQPDEPQPDEPKAVPETGTATADGGDEEPSP